MTKLARILCSICLLAGLLAGSAQVLSAAEVVEIRFFHCCGQDYRNALYEEFSREFERLNPGVKIIDSFPAAAGGGYSDNIKVAIAGGLPPDVMWMGNGMWNFVDQLLDLNVLYKNVPLISEILPSVIQSHMWEGELKAIPFGLNTHAIFYNADLFAAAGVTMPADWSWQEAINIAKKLTRDTNADGQIDQWGIQLSELTHAYQQGGDFYTPDLRKVNFNNPASIAGVQLYADLVTGVYGCHPPSGSGNARDNFINGKVAMSNFGVFESDVIDPSADFEWDVQLFPTLTVGGKTTRTSWYSSETWVVYNKTKHPDIVLKFVEFLVSRENMGKFARTRAVIPSQPSVAVSSFLTLDMPRSISVFTKALDWWSRNSAHPSGLAITAGGYHSQIFSGQMAAATAIPEMERYMNNILDEYWAARGK
ncbi:MAG TPA: sugar ABC transporter substrate-binding protein [Firmicutes bacterium]|nr:sugar ABC transporter substrate-binding protein [Bacillota bacterium]